MRTVYKRAAKGSPVAILDPSDSIQIFHTREYSQFRLAPENRPISKSHLTKLKRSIEENGYFTDHPIHVVRRDGALLVTDGQHRYQACVDLDLEIYYLIRDVEPADASRSIRVVNANAKPWRDHEFLHHFVTLGYPSYVALQAFMERHDLNMGAATGMLLTAGEGGLKANSKGREQFRCGAFSFTDDDVAEGDRRMIPVNEIRNFHEKFRTIRKDAALIKALLVMTSSRHYEHDRFMSNLGRNVGNFVPCTSVQNYLAMLEPIYNYKRKDGTRVVLSRKGMTRIAAAEAEVPQG